MSEAKRLKELAQMARKQADEWQAKAWAQSYAALFHEDPSCRPKCLEHANLYHGRMMEAKFWHDQIQSAIFSDSDQMSTTVDKQAEVTAVAVVLGEDNAQWKWYECDGCRVVYDQVSAHAKKLVCCGHSMKVCDGVSLHDKTNG